MTETKENTLLIAEDFYSCQCEGITTGYPAYFVRLANCNLSCGARMAFVNQFKKDQVDYDPGTFQGDLHAEGKATWTCDTIPVWAKGVERDYDYLINRWKEQGIYEDIKKGIIHIIWTGGEPTIPQHQKAIIGFHNYWAEEVFSGSDYVSFTPYVEIETNGTFEIEEELMQQLDQINCSPKLANSGMTEKQRIVPAAIESIKKHLNYQFKFVISSEEDVQEVFESFVEPFEMPLQYVVCMPGLDSQENFHERTRFVLEMAKKYKFIGLTRLHVSAWDKTTGV
jgi:7-carboxy-7-deazaguanine synthase